MDKEKIKQLKDNLVKMETKITKLDLEFLRIKKILTNLLNFDSCFVAKHRPAEEKPINENDSDDMEEMCEW